jgi:hypothetical protein
VEHDVALGCQPLEEPGIPDIPNLEIHLRGPGQVRACARGQVVETNDDMTLSR